MATPDLNAVWVYYNTIYEGNLLQADFMRLAVREEMVLDDLIFGRTVPDEMENRYKMTLCEMVDYAYETNSVTEESGIVESETIDGYSVKYRETSVVHKLMDRRRIAEKYLTYPKNLLYCGVGYTWSQTEI